MGLLDSLLGRKTNKTQTSASAAKERLQFALVSDRVKITPEQLEQIKDEIVSVLSRHFEIDRDAMEINWGERKDRIVADIPMKRVRTRTS
jgi:cell division topological specificity factor